MSRLITLVLGILFVQQTMAAQSPSSAAVTGRDSLVHGTRDTVRASKAGHDSLALARPDSAIRITPMRSVGSLTPASPPYPGLDADGIRWNEYRTLTDLFAGIPEIFVRDLGSPGQDNRVTINGAEHNGTSFLVDGISQNDPVTGTYNFAFFPVEAIERLELVTGPRSFLYGDHAVGGTINVISKNFANNKPYTHIRYSQGGNSYTQTDAMFSQNILARFNLSVGISYLGFGSDLGSVHYQGRFLNSDNEAYTFRTKLRYNVSQEVNLVFTHFYYSTKTGLNGGVDITKTLASGNSVYDETGAVVVNLDSYQKMFNHHAALTGYYRPLADSTISGSLSLFGSRQSREYRDEENRLEPNGIFIQDNFGSTILGVRAQGDWELRGNLLSAIAEVRETQFDPSIYGAEWSRASRSLSLKDELSPVRALKLAAFIKLENSQEKTLQNLGADASLVLSGRVTFSGGTSIAHRRPTVPELSLASGNADTTIQKILAASGTPPSPGLPISLSDEIHHISEGGVRINPSENFQAGITATRRTIERWIDLALIKPVQKQDLILDYLTVCVRVRQGDFYLDGEAVYTRQSEVLRGGVPLRLYPEWRGDGSLYFRGRLANGHLDLKAGLRGRFYSAYDGEQFRTVDGVPNPNINRPIGNAGTLDLFIIAHLGDAYIHVMWDNVTNSAYMLAPFYPMYDQTIRFGVSWEFWD
jgi:hypothetical protein